MVVVLKIGEQIGDTRYGVVKNRSRLRPLPIRIKFPSCRTYITYIAWLIDVAHKHDDIDPVSTHHKIVGLAILTKVHAVFRGSKYNKALQETKRLVLRMVSFAAWYKSYIIGQKQLIKFCPIFPLLYLDRMLSSC